MERFVAICLAGALGTGARYGVNLWAQARFGDSFPYATLFVNTAGCFLIALVMQASMLRVNFSDTLRLALTTGFLGGLTTYSAFNYETTRLFEAGAYRAAIFNVVGTLVVCGVAGLAGLFVARVL